MDDDSNTCVELERPDPHDKWGIGQEAKKGLDPATNTSSTSLATVKATIATSLNKKQTTKTWYATMSKRPATLMTGIAIAVAALIILVMLIFVLSVAVWPTPRPHIIVFLADDLGWSDLSFHGNGQIPTPHIDAMCSDGIVLNSHYSQPSSSASRAALLTGKYPIRYGLQEYSIRAGTKEALPLDIKLLPQYLKELGYKTHLIGKWHLGFYEEKFLPNNRGFDTFDGYYNEGGDYYRHTHTELDRYRGYDWHTNDKVDKSVDGRYATDIITERMEHLLKKWNRIAPIFLMISHMAPHGGPPESRFQVDQKCIKDPAIAHIRDAKRTAYAGMVRALDDAFGKTVAALKRYGLLDNCIILFSSANGGTSHADEESPTGASNWPLRGQKWSLWEGGSRVASFIWSPLIASRRYVNNRLLHFTDWLPTFYAQAGGDLRNLPRDLDGHNIWPSIVNNTDSPRKTLLINYDTGGTEHFAIRWGRFKLIHGLPTTICTVQGARGGWYNEWYTGAGGSLVDPMLPQRYMKNTLTYRIITRFPDFESRPDTWRDEGRLTCQPKHLYARSRQGYNSSTFGSEKMKQQSVRDIDDELCSGDHNRTCLFDLLRDPCEREQYWGADRHDLIYKLIELGNEFLNGTAKALTPWKNRSSLIDKASEPARRDGSWTPWISQGSHTNV